MSKLVVVKTGYDARTESSPINTKFHSDFNTLKHQDIGVTSIEINANDGENAGVSTVSHNLGFFPYIDVYVSVSIDGGSSSNFTYCPFFDSGARVGYDATYAITSTQIKFYAQIIGEVGGVWTFTFKYFIFKNKINL